ncbi:hypothetical protein [Rhizobium sp. MHM7A]|uniref:hypothetical protein n=1 Tax=Rhizobium sp. MHM7A TaxID=2583233 RepID=UPI001105E1A1|nr:hypothetical protein [Rhizobium sp. MHM7A]TLX16050.1 hypothetical protein FFR93_01650 [Rhizobium sp. MHM7A]
MKELVVSGYARSRSACVWRLLVLSLWAGMAALELQGLGDGDRHKYLSSVFPATVLGIGYSGFMRSFTRLEGFLYGMSAIPPVVGLALAGWGWLFPVLCERMGPGVGFSIFGIGALAVTGMAVYAALVHGQPVLGEGKKATKTVYLGTGLILLLFGVVLPLMTYGLIKNDLCSLYKTSDSMTPVASLFMFELVVFFGAAYSKVKFMKWKSRNSN